MTNIEIKEIRGVTLIYINGIYFNVIKRMNVDSIL